MPDLLGPGLAHHRLEPGLASLRVGLDHLWVDLGPGLGHLRNDLGHLRDGLGPDLDHHELDPGICWWTQLRVRWGL